MKTNLIFFFFLITIGSAFGMEKSREIKFSEAWSFISCKQMENGGITIQRRHLPENARIQIFAPSYENAVYEVFMDGDLLASCKFISIATNK